eukprot:649303-Hanusia_phi.AAC.2
MAFGGTRYRSTRSVAPHGPQTHLVTSFSSPHWLHRVRFGMQWRWGWSGLLAAGRIAVSLRLRTGLRSPGSGTVRVRPYGLRRGLLSPGITCP